MLATDAYGKSKVFCEKLVTEWCIRNNVKFTILRLPLLIGRNPPGNLGDMIKAIKNKYYFNIRHVNPRKSMVLAQDVANVILKASTVGGIYNLTDGYHPSFCELSQCISAQLGKGKIYTIPFFFINFLAKLGDTLIPFLPINSHRLIKMTDDLTFDDAKARKAFGWKPTSILDGFKL